MYAIDFVSPKGRFARSANVERDAGTRSVDSYLPTGRALDVVSRLARCIDGESGTRAFSITGPYGTGKSSLALFLDALFGPNDDRETLVGLGVLSAVDPATAALLAEGKKRSGELGFVRCVVTATREPISATLIRAMAQGVHRFPISHRRTSWKGVVSKVKAAVAELDDRERPLPTTRFILDLLAEINAVAPILIVIDEFGKNLEAFSESRSEADLYLLQQLVEWSSGARDEAFPVVTVTMQHLSFEEYLDLVSLALRREWAKVQGRFEDIPYIDTPAQTRHLIAQVNEEPVDRSFLKKRNAWARQAHDDLRKTGLAHEVDINVVERSWPLHPSALLVLPELCARYGQNERTLFSFLASAEPLAIPAWLATESIGGALRDVRLDRVYDYFVESAATSVATSQTASRWVEVETAIRDATGLSDAERRILKAVGLLNLVSAGGSVRASKRVLSWACADGRDGTIDSSEATSALHLLEQSGRITYREFADEYRLWRGSDLDLRATVETERRRLRQQTAEVLLTKTRTMLPVVAARHSTETGTLRVFHRLWNADGQLDANLDAGDSDGILVYVLGPKLPVVSDLGIKRPVVAVRPQNTDDLLKTSLELAAIRAVLDDSETLGEDWVARREMAEREAEALAHFDIAFESAVGHVATGTEWWLLNGVGHRARRLSKPKSLTAALSLVCDETYAKSPRVANEMLNRHELTSQGAKARRLLIEALLSKSDLEHFGIVGFPPERAMYDAMFGATGMHRRTSQGYEIGEPTSPDWAEAWRTLTETLDLSKTRRVSIDQVIEKLKAPPIGMKAGAASVFVIAGIVAHRREVALYEHGTYKPQLTSEMAERLLRNPSHFQIKHFAATHGPRRLIVEELAKTLGIESWRGNSPTVLSVVGYLVSMVNSLPAYSLRTKNLSDEAISVRRALIDATEPDVLLFETLPAALEVSRKSAGERRLLSLNEVQLYAEALRFTIAELRSLHQKLLDEVVSELVAATGARSSKPRAELAERAQRMQSKVIDQRLRALLAALVDQGKDDLGWAEYVAMTVVGPATGSWTDDERLRFLASIKELGGTLRRIEAIYFDRLALDDESFDALRLTITRSDGLEVARVVGLDERTHALVDNCLDDVLARIGLDVENSTNAVELLLAALAERMLLASSQSVSHVESIVNSKAQRARKRQGNR